MQSDALINPSIGGAQETEAGGYLMASLVTWLAIAEALLYQFGANY